MLSKKICGLLMFSDFGKLYVHVSTRKKTPLLKLGSEFKDYDFHFVQTLEKRFKTLTAFPFWLTKFIQEVANKMGGDYLPCSL